MAHKRSEVPELEKMLQYGRKKFVRYDEGAKIYSMGLHGYGFEYIVHTQSKCQKMNTPISEADIVERLSSSFIDYS